MKTKLSIMYQYWLEMVSKDGFAIDHLGNIFWLQSEFDLTYKQARIVNRMFEHWALSGGIY